LDRRATYHSQLFSHEHCHPCDGRRVVTIGKTDMREEFASLAFLATAFAGIVLLASGLLALVVVG
jgi:hypothetical protein